MKKLFNKFSLNSVNYHKELRKLNKCFSVNIDDKVINTRKKEEVKSK